MKAGITTIRDVGSSNRIAPDVRDAIEEGRIPGPRMRAAGAVLCMTGGHGWPIGRAVDSPWDARKAVREQMWGGADCIKMIATGGVLTKGAVPGNAQLTFDELAAAIDEAHRHGLRVAAHAIGTQGIKNALRAGIDSIEHGTMLDDEAIALFKERNVYLVPTLSAPTCILAHLEDGHQPKYVVEKARGLNEAMLANIRRAYESGVRIAGGSDAGTPYNYHENYAQEAELMWSLLGMTPQQALHAATNVAAELVGLHRGMLAVGEPADMLLLAARRRERRARAARTADSSSRTARSNNVRTLLFAGILFLARCAGDGARRCRAWTGCESRPCSANRLSAARSGTSSCSCRRTARSTISLRRRCSPTAAPIRAPTRRRRATVDGKTVGLNSVSFEYPADPSHTHPALLGEWDDGKMDGFENDKVYAPIGFARAGPGFTYAYLPATRDGDLSRARRALRARRPQLRARGSCRRSRATTRSRPRRAASPETRTPRFGAATRISTHDGPDLRRRARR